VVVMETTFIMEDDRDMARPKGHTHLFELFEFLAANPDLAKFEFLVLKHFSMKYTQHQIETAVRKRVPDFLRERVLLLL